ncbi:MAG: AAA family ATPase, partial [Richelia sp. RM2_1_2]|nr:AAA family ATPase [Richelia sp. RM2_1_2]
MAKNHFKVKTKVKLHEMEIGAEIQESDFACISGEYFVQLEHFQEEEKIEPYKVSPGIWSIQKTMAGLKLTPTSFSQDKVLESFVHTKNITEKVDKFYSRLDTYKKFGIEVPKRCMLLYGPAGSGKSQAINKIARTYSEQKDIAVIIWKTDVIDPHDVKEFVKSFEYHGVQRLLVIAEDIGGVEVDQVRIKSESSLLSLLDNQEKSFTIPVMIIATTNYPENLLANLTNRPQRIDDKIEVGYPSPEMRQELFKFFAGTDVVPKEILNKIKDKKYKEFTPAHIKETFVRSGIYDISLEEALNQVAGDIDKFNKMFKN